MYVSYVFSSDMNQKIKLVWPNYEAGTAILLASRIYDTQNAALSARRVCLQIISEELFVVCKIIYTVPWIQKG